MGELTKEEVVVMVDVMTKNALHLENIANSLRLYSDTLKSINERLHNGMAKEIITSIKCDLIDTQKEVLRELQNLNINLSDTEKDGTLANKLVLIKSDTGSNKTNIAYSKWFIAIIAIAIIVVTSIIRGIDNRWLFTKTAPPIITKEIEIQLLKDIKKDIADEMQKMWEQKFENSTNRSLESH